MRNALLIILLLCLGGPLYSQIHVPLKNENGVYFAKGTVNGGSSSILYDEDAKANYVSLSFAKKLFNDKLLTAANVVSFPGTDTVSLTSIIKLQIQLDSVTLTNVVATVVDNFAADVLIGEQAFKGAEPALNYSTNTLWIPNGADIPSFRTPSKLTMLNGKNYNVALTKFDSEFIQFKYKKPKKIYNATREKVFSVTDSLGRMSYVYYQDTAIGRPLSVYQMQNFLIGFNDGRRYRWGGDFAIGFASGVGGSFLGVLYGFSIPIGASALNSAFKPKVSGHRVAHPGLMYDEYYQNGLRKKVRQRKIVATLFGGAVGMGVGIAVFQFLIRPLSDL